MSDHTGIEWTDATWNPVVGCRKVSEGCRFCYAKTLHDMRHEAVLAGKTLAPQYAEPFERVQLMPDRLAKPLSWRKPRKIFVNSVSDLFHDDVPDAFILEVFSVMAQAERHTFQVLTKRPARMLHWFTEYLPDACSGEWPAPEWPLPNVWLGVSVENQAAADERIPLLLQTPAAVRWLSCEPLLGPIDLNVSRTPGADDDEITDEDDALGPPLGGARGIDWVVGGGESGSSKQNPRPMRAKWVRSLRDQCVENNVPFLFKQWGDWRGAGTRPSGTSGKFAIVDDDGPLFVDAYPSQYAAFGSSIMERVGKKRAGRELDGRTWDEYPATEARRS